MIISCGGGESKKSENAISQGVIEYDAKVLNNEHPLTPYAPDKATVKVKNDKWHLEMSAMGFFHIYFICNLQNKTLSQMVKCMDFQNACIDDTNEVAKENNTYALEFKETKETKIIAGYTCKRVIAKKVSDPTSVFDVYYTPDIGTENCNELTPYKQIKGMLMDYRMVRLGIEMRFEAKSVKKVDIEDSEFDMPDFYSVIPRSEFNEKLTAFLSTLL